MKKVNNFLRRLKWSESLAESARLDRNIKTSPRLQTVMHFSYARKGSSPGFTRSTKKVKKTATTKTRIAEDFNVNLILRWALQPGRAYEQSVIPSSYTFKHETCVIRIRNMLEQAGLTFVTVALVTIAELARPPS